MPGYSTTRTRVCKNKHMSSETCPALLFMKAHQRPGPGDPSAARACSAKRTVTRKLLIFQITWRLTRRMVWWFDHCIIEDDPLARMALDESLPRAVLPISWKRLASANNSMNHGPEPRQSQIKSTPYRLGRTTRLWTTRADFAFSAVIAPVLLSDEQWLTLNP